MDATYIITSYVLLDDWYQMFGERVTHKPKLHPSEIMLVAVIAAKYFNNHLERALCVLHETGYLTTRLSVSRFNRQLHQQRGQLDCCLATLLELACAGEVFIIDSQPVPVCKRKRAWRCRKIRGRLYCGYCPAKDEKYFGWKLHLICTADGMPVAFSLVPAACHDLTPIHELSYELPTDARLLGDKGYNSAADEQFLATDGLHLIPRRKVNMKQQHDWADEYDLRLHRHLIETLNSQFESMGFQRLRARTNEGFFIKVAASLIALYHTRSLAAALTN